VSVHRYKKLYIMGQLDRQLNIERNAHLTSSEMEGGTCLSSDGALPTSTSLGGLPLPAVKELEEILAEMGVFMDTQDVDRFGQFIMTIVKHSVKN